MENQNNSKNKGKKVLIVEDEISLLDAIAIKLTTAGFTVLKATDGIEGLKQAILNRPGVILLDVVMPHMDGFTMLHKLREDEWGRLASVIMLTNLEADDERLSNIVVDKPSYYLVKANSSLEHIVEKVQDVFMAQEESVQRILDAQKIDEQKEM